MIKLCPFGLTLVLILLKVTKVISLSWLWCFAPIWLPVALMVILGLAMLFLVAVIIGFGIAIIWALDRYTR